MNTTFLNRIIWPVAGGAAILLLLPAAMVHGQRRDLPPVNTANVRVFTNTSTATGGPTGTTGLGISLSDASGQVTVTGLGRQGPLSAMGLRVGDQILAVNGQPVSTIADTMSRLLTAAQQNQTSIGSITANMTISRNGQQQLFNVPASTLTGLLQFQSQVQALITGLLGATAATNTSTTTSTGTGTTTSGTTGASTTGSTTTGATTGTTGTTTTGTGTTSPAATILHLERSPPNSAATTVTDTTTAASILHQAAQQAATLRAQGVTAQDTTTSDTGTGTGGGTATNEQVQQALDTRAAINQQQGIATPRALQAAPNVSAARSLTGSTSPPSDTTNSDTTTEIAQTGNAAATDSRVQEALDQRAAINRQQGIATPSAQPTTAAQTTNRAAINANTGAGQAGTSTLSEAQLQQALEQRAALNQQQGIATPRATQGATRATPATPATPAIPGTSPAIPATPATPATPPSDAAGQIPMPTVDITPSGPRIAIPGQMGQGGRSSGGVGVPAGGGTRGSGKAPPRGNSVPARPNTGAARGAAGAGAAVHVTGS